MRFDYCLILAAGFGTRMGIIRKELPKVLWPVFENIILELQVAYARSLGARRIFIHLHYTGEKSGEWCKTRPASQGVTLLWEKPEHLDSGGALHILARVPEVNQQRRFFVLNADQLFYISKDQLEKYGNPFQK